jgi:hypothetical protein
MGASGLAPVTSCSIVARGFELTLYVTLFAPQTSFLFGISLLR